MHPVLGKLRPAFTPQVGRCLTLSITLNMSTSSRTRWVMTPCTSPIRSTVCLSRPLAAVRLMRAASYMSTEITDAITPSVLPQPTMLAIFSLLTQFCSDTTPVRSEIRLDQHCRPLGVVRHQAHERDIDGSLLRKRLHFGKVHRLRIFTVNFSSGGTPSSERPRDRVASIFSGHMSISVMSWP
jgi:hypothetical protein